MPLVDLDFHGRAVVAGHGMASFVVTIQAEPPPPRPTPRPTQILAAERAQAAAGALEWLVPTLWTERANASVTFPAWAVTLAAGGLAAWAVRRLFVPPNRHSP